MVSAEYNRRLPHVVLIGKRNFCRIQNNVCNVSKIIRDNSPLSPRRFFCCVIVVLQNLSDLIRAEGQIEVFNVYAGIRPYSGRKISRNRAKVHFLVHCFIRNGIRYKLRKLFLIVVYYNSLGAASSVTANGLLEAAGVATVNFAELAWVGIPLTVLGVLYIAFFGHKIIPDTGHDFTGLPVYSEEDEKNESTTKQIITAVVFLAIIVCMIVTPFGWPLYFISSVGALILILTGCITEKQAYAAIDWPTIVICGAMIAVGSAVTKTGGSDLIANWVVKVLGENPNPTLITLVICLVVTVVTQFMSNVSTATLMTPIAIAIAQGIGCNPKTIGIIVIIAANASMLTPVGAQAFTVVYGPGKFKFMDFFKVGLPLVIVNTLLAVLLVPQIWPFF